MKRIFLFFFFVALLATHSCTSYVSLSKVEGASIALSDSIVGDPTISTLVAPYRQLMSDSMNAVLAHSELVMEKDLPEGVLGNFVADLTLQTAVDFCAKRQIGGADFCVLNNGGLRTTLPEGAITRGRIFELMPFENEIVLLKLAPEKISLLMDYVAVKKGVPVSGIKIGIWEDQAKMVEINGLPVDSTKSYWVVTTDYLAYGGDHMDCFANPIEKKFTKIKLRDAIIDYLVRENDKGNKLTSRKDGRVYYQ